MFQFSAAQVVGNHHLMTTSQQCPGKVRANAAGASGYQRLHLPLAYTGCLQSSRIAFLIAQHPAINHAVILRDVRYLRATFDIQMASVRPPDRPLDQLSPEERDEAERTYYIKSQGAGGAAAALVSAFVLNPARFFGGAFYGARLGGLRLKQIFLNLAYFIEAAMVGLWMRRNGLNKLHTHYSSTVALLVHKTFGFDLSISFHGPDEFNDPAGFWVREKVAASKFVRAISQ